jgi:hypothetical protein
MSKSFTVEVKYRSFLHSIFLGMFSSGWPNPVPNERRITTIADNMARNGYQLRDRYDDPMRRMTTLTFYRREESQ